MWRHAFLLLVMTLPACDQSRSNRTAVGSAQTAVQKPTANKDAATDKQAALAFMEKMEHERRFRMGVRLRDILKDGGQAEPLVAIQRGCLELLQQGTPEEKRRAARFLGRLEKPSAIVPLVKALEASDADLREAICRALEWLQANDEPVESALVKLRKQDPCADVRMAAALSLGRLFTLRHLADPDAVAAFELCLQSTSSGYYRERCEFELEKIGKLQLPLAAWVYTDVSYDEYEALKADRWYAVKRETRKGAYIYFETTERPHHVPFDIRNWYRTKALAPGEKTLT